MADPQATVQALLDELVARDEERGLQVAVYFQGEQVVDAWSGVADPATGRTVDGDTLFPVFSTTKGIVATVIHLLAERGIVEYDAPVARYWPEFAANGKAGITVRHALAHTAGVPQLPDGVTAADLCDWDATCRGIAALEPLWEPGTATGYHALSYGWILGEVARRADGRPFDQIVREEICAPLGIVDLFVGIPDAVEDRVAPMEVDPHAAPAPPLPPDALANRAIPLTVQPLADFINRPDTRRAVIPGGGGIMTARAIARHYAALTGDERDGTQLLPPARLRLATALQTEATDLVAGTAMRKALGYMLGMTGSPRSTRASAFGHGGAGGSEGFSDPEHRLAFGLTKNRRSSARPARAPPTAWRRRCAPPSASRVIRRHRAGGTGRMTQRLLPASISPRPAPRRC
ncbi:MAG: serine hydrolase domain-containing protein [Thermomicrobiales bacterium]